MAKQPEIPTVAVNFDELSLVRRAKKERKKAVKRLEDLDRKRRELVPLTGRLDKAVVELIQASVNTDSDDPRYFPVRDHQYRYAFDLPGEQEPFHVSITASILDQGKRYIDPATSDAWRYTISGPYTRGHGSPLHDLKKDGNNNYAVLGFGKDGKQVSTLPKPKTITNYANLITGLTQGIQAGAVRITSRG